MPNLNNILNIYVCNVMQKRSYHRLHFRGSEELIKHSKDESVWSILNAFILLELIYKILICFTYEIYRKMYLPVTLF